MDFKHLNDRFQKIKKANKRTLTIFGIGFAFFALGVSLGSFLIVIIGTIFLILSMIVASKMGASAYYEIKSIIQNEYIFPCLNEAFKDFKYDDIHGMNSKIIDELEFIDSGDRIHSFNTMEGYYRDVAFIQSGVRCDDYYRDSDGNNKVRVVFSGRVIILGLSLFQGKGFVDIVSTNSFEYKMKTAAKKVTLTNELEKYYDIYVSNDGISLNESIMDYFTSLAKNYPEYKFYFRITSNKLYLVIDGINTIPYSIKNLDYINKEELDLLIKKESCFITNTISNVLD